MIFVDYNWSWSWALVNSESYAYSIFKRHNERARRKIARLGLSYSQMQKDITKIYLDIQKARMRGDMTSVRDYLTEKEKKKMTKLSRKNSIENMRQGVELLSVQAVSFKKRRFFEKVRVRIEGKYSRSDDCEPEFFAEYCVFVKNDQEGWRLHSARRPSYQDRSIYSGRYG